MNPNRYHDSMSKAERRELLVEHRKAKMDSGKRIKEIARLIQARAERAAKRLRGETDA